MLTQGLPFQFTLVVATGLQDRQHLGHEIVQAFALCGESRMKPSLAPASNQRISSSATCSGVPMKFGRGLTASSATWRRLSPFTRILLDAVGGGAERVAADVTQLREGRVRIVLAEIVVVEEAAEIGQRILQRGQCSDRLVFGFGLLGRAADDGADTGKILTSLPLRPCAIAEFFTFWVNARVSSSDGEWVNTASAYLPANAMPSSEEPAWKITGWPCGERWMLSGPSTWKKRPL